MMVPDLNEVIVSISIHLFHSRYSMMRLLQNSFLIMID